MTASAASAESFPGVSLKYSVQVTPRHSINGFCWSSNGMWFAIAEGATLQLRDTASGSVNETFNSATGPISHLAWSPDGAWIAASTRYSVHVWDVDRAQLAWSHKIGMIASKLVWSPSSRYLAITGANAPTLVLDRNKRNLVGTYGINTSGAAWLPGGVMAVTDQLNFLAYFQPPVTGILRAVEMQGPVADVVWSKHHGLLAIPTERGPIELWDPKKRRLRLVLEGHTSAVNAVSFSADGVLLASTSYDKTVKLWKCADWSLAATFEAGHGESPFPILAFHPRKPVLAMPGKTPDTLDAWDVDVEKLFKPRRSVPSTSPNQGIEAGTRPTRYGNAKVVLVGDSGVGKSGLGLVLTKQPFAATLSTHGRNVWMFESKKVKLDGKLSETRETLLWDLAGQPGYRLVHQLHLNEIAVALVVFDAQSDTDPLAGVRHWDRALRQAQRIQGSSAPPLKKFLVAARVDRGHVSLSQERIGALVRSLGFDGYFKTSAKEGWQIPELIQAIRQAIDWDALPRVSSTELLEKLKAFIIVEKEAGRLLSTGDDLYRAFLKSPNAPPETPELRNQFEMCIDRVAWRGLIRRLSFGGLVLLQPELLDAYASALVNAAKDEPDGLGSIPEEVARNGTFPIPQDERVKHPDQEKLLLIAMVEDLLHHEIALREHSDGGPYLTFPSQLTREMPDLQELKGKAVVFGFEGPVLNVYATLVVRLSHSNWFQKKGLWKNAAIFTTKARGAYGIALREPEEGKGHLTVFYDDAATQESKVQFEEYILAHLRRRSLPDTLSRRRIVTCAHCDIRISDEQATGRLKLGLDSIKCPVCERAISLRALVEQVPPSVAPRVVEMEQGADARRDVEKAVTTIEGKRATGDYDVFFSYNTADREAVLRIAGRLAEHGLLAWVDVEAIPPGTSVQKELEKQLKRCKAAAVFVGKKGVGPWQQQEVEARLQAFVKRKSSIIPVLLEDAPKKPKLPIFLGNIRWVDFREKEPEPLKELLWGITGKRA